MADLARRAGWGGLGHVTRECACQMSWWSVEKWRRYYILKFRGNTFRWPMTLTFDLKFWKYLSVTEYPYSMCMLSFMMIGWEMAEILHIEISRKHVSVTYDLDLWPKILKIFVSHRVPILNVYVKFHDDRLRNDWDITLWNFAKTRTNKHTNTQTNRHGHYNTSPSPYGGRGKYCYSKLRITVLVSYDRTIHKFGSKFCSQAVSFMLHLSLIFSVCIFAWIVCIDRVDSMDITSFIWKIMRNIPPDQCLSLSEECVMMLLKWFRVCFNVFCITSLEYVHHDSHLKKNIKYIILFYDIMIRKLSILQSNAWLICCCLCNLNNLHLKTGIGWKYQNPFQMFSDSIVDHCSLTHSKWQNDRH